MRRGLKSGLLGILVGTMLASSSCGKNTNDSSPEHNNKESVFNLFEDDKVVVAENSPVEKNSYFERQIIYEKYEEIAPSPSEFKDTSSDKKALLIPYTYIKDFPNQIVRFDVRSGDKLYNVQIWNKCDGDIESAKDKLEAQVAYLAGGNGVLRLDLRNVRLFGIKSGPDSAVGFASFNHTLFKDEVFADRGVGETPTPFNVLGEQVGLDSSHWFPEQRQHFGPISIGLGANNKNLSINLDNSKAYAIFSQPIPYLHSGNQVTLSPISLVEGEAAQELIGVVRKDPDHGSRFDKNSSVVYKIFNGEPNTSHGTWIASYPRLGGIRHYLEYSVNNDYLEKGLSVAFVGDFEFLHNINGEKERVTTCSIYTRANPSDPAR